MTAEGDGAFRTAVANAQRGDPHALGWIWERLQPVLLRYLRGRRVSDPADLASVVWLDVATGIGRFTGGERDFTTWLFTIARRRHIDEIRKVSRRRIGPLEERHAPVVHDPDTADLDRALELIAQLPDDMGEAILLRYLGDLDVADIAEVLGQRPGTVRVSVHRGLRRLQRMIGADE